jgi:DNA-binding transcriptional regulator YiaG
MHAGFDLKIARLRTGMKQFVVAARLSVTPQFVSQIELGRKRIPEGLAERYLAAVDEYSQRARAAGLLPEAADEGRSS